MHILFLWKIYRKVIIVFKLFQKKKKKESKSGWKVESINIIKVRLENGWISKQMI